MFQIVVGPSPLPLEDWAKIFMPVWAQVSTDIKVLSDKPSVLKDGTPAREVEVEGIGKSGHKWNGVLLATKKGMAWVSILLTDSEGKIGEGVRKIAYSLAFLPGREEPVIVPPDIRAFLDMYGTDMVSHDVGAIMGHFSDRFFQSGLNKAFLERFFRSDPTSPIQRNVISFEPTVTVFEPRGDRAYIDGFVMERAKGGASPLKAPMVFQQIIKEHGEWRWFGSQK
jgi:hypothetical protein